MERDASEQCYEAESQLLRGAAACLFHLSANESAALDLALQPRLG